jgi:exopolysaccharide production protein ExoY
MTIAIMRGGEKQMDWRVSSDQYISRDAVDSNSVEVSDAASHQAVLHHGRRKRASSLRPKVKRAIDVVGATLLLFIVTPVLTMMVLAVKADGGPVFFAHKRIGRNGREFSCLKIRTMRVDADRALRDLLERDACARAEWYTARKLRNDPRITRIGSVLRSTSLDELPQLINVLRGDMSLVGPRPVVREELEDHYRPLDGATAYLSMRPGLTGPWQISGRRYWADSADHYERRVALDKDYAENMSIWGDIVIIFRTVVAVIRREGC